MRRILLAVLIAVSAAAAPRTGLVSFQRIAIPEDVPAHLCSAMVQDARGFLWIGTQGGLVRYDGYSFRVFRTHGSYVRALHVARDGRIWIGTFSGGLSVLDPSTEKLDVFPLTNNRVEAIAEDRDGAIWAGTNDGLHRVDPRTKKAERFLAGDTIRALLIDRNGSLWIGSRAGLQRRTSNGFERVDMRDQLVTKLFEDSRGRLWIGTAEHGAAVRNGSTLHRFSPGTLSHFWVYGFAEATKDELWIATFGGGIDVVDMRSLAIIDRLRHDATMQSTIGADRVGAILRDRSGVVWVGTWGEGIARHDPTARAFRELRLGNGLTHPSVVRALEASDGTIWAGTNGNGIDLFDGDFNLIGGHRANVLGDGSITCLAEAPDGAMWIATLNGSLHRFVAGRFEHIIEGLPGGPIRTIAFGKDGAVWAGAAQGMARIRGTEVRKYGNETLGGVAVESIVVAPDGKLWVGTDGGLNHFDPVRETAARVVGLPDKWVPDLLLARDGRVWAGTNGGAMIVGGPLVTNTPAEALLEDSEGNVWIGPGRRIDPKTLRQQTFGPAEGLEFRSFFIASRARMRDGRLLFGSAEGLLIVDPKLITPWTHVPNVVATSVRVGNEERPSTATRVRIEPDARTLRVDFAALEFTAPQRIAYRYKLEGYDREWNHAAATQRSLVYSRMPPGSYVLRVQATNRAGMWNAQELRMHVDVVAAFYETWWFRMLVAAAIAALVYLAYRLRVRQLRARSAMLEQVVRARTRELETAYATIEQASLTDPLTGLRNRRYLEQVITPDAELSLRQGEDLLFFLLDLDHFKSVNDAYGHAAGDAVLVQIAEVLRATFRASDHLVRWGGEEFLIVARFVDRSHAPDLAEKIRAAIAAHPFVLPDGTIIRKTCSIGFAAWPQPTTRSWEHIVDAADAALYEAKRSGRDRWVAA